MVSWASKKQNSITLSIAKVEYVFVVSCCSQLLWVNYLMQSYPPRALDRKLQEDWARDAREGPRVLMSLRVDFGAMG